MKKFKKVMLVGLIALMATGCQSTRQNAMTGEDETNGLTKGVLGGCVGGAIIGAIANKGTGAAVGCVAGGAVGGVIGNNMDQQEADLRKELLDTGVQIQRVGEDQIKLVLDGDITFASGKTDVSNSIKPTLSSIAKVMEEYDDTKLVIEGHTDSVGSDSSNKNLSYTRAAAVEKEMARRGLSRDRMEITGFGEMIPICTNKTKAGQACNRRVELKIIAIPSQY